MLEDYVRRSFRIRAVRITEENIGEVAKMMNSEVKRRHFASGYKNHFEIVEGPDDVRAQVYVGDWLTWMGGKFKRYTNKLFKYTFEKPKDDHACTDSCKGVQGIRGLLEHVGIDTSGRDISVGEEVVDSIADRMQREHHTNPEIHARNDKVLAMVYKALREAPVSDSSEKEISEEVAYNIIKLFY